MPRVETVDAAPTQFEITLEIQRQIGAGHYAAGEEMTAHPVSGALVHKGIWSWGGQHYEATANAWLNGVELCGERGIVDGWDGAALVEGIEQQIRAAFRLAIGRSPEEADWETKKIIDDYKFKMQKAEQDINTLQTNVRVTKCFPMIPHG